MVKFKDAVLAIALGVWIVVNCLFHLLFIANRSSHFIYVLDHTISCRLYTSGLAPLLLICCSVCLSKKKRLPNLVLIDNTLIAEALCPFSVLLFWVCLGGRGLSIPLPQCYFPPWLLMLVALVDPSEGTHVTVFSSP